MIRETQKESKVAEDPERLDQMQVLTLFWKPGFESGVWPQYPSQPKRIGDGNENTTSNCSSEKLTLV